jgi:hypothetical protein
MTFLPVWDKDSYKETFLVLFPCTYVLQPQLVHLFSPLHSSLVHFSWWPPACLRFLYSFLYCEHINLTQVFSFLPLPYPSVCPIP